MSQHAPHDPLPAEGGGGEPIAPPSAADGVAAPEALQKPGFAEEALPHLDAVYHFALRLVQGDTAEAEDLVQETFLRAYRAWESFEPGSNARAWLMTICRNAFLHHVRRARVRPMRVEVENEAALEALANTAVFQEVRARDPERAFFESFVDGEVLAAVDALPPEFREAVVLADMEGLSYQEIAEALAVPIGTVKSRLYRGRRLLQEALYEYAVETGILTRGRV